MFLGRKSPEKAVIQTSEGVCISDDTCDLQAQDEIDIIEALENKASDQLDMLAHLAEDWDVLTRNVAVYIADRRRNIAMGDVAASNSRDMRRNLERSQEAFLASEIAAAHNRAARDLPGSIEEIIWRDNLPKEGAPSPLLLKGQSQLLIRKMNKKIHERASSSSSFLYEGILGSFQHAYLARAYMQSINEQNPEALQMAFDPSSLKELPSSLQRLVLIDLAHGSEGSVLLNNAAKATLPDQTQEERLSSYIKGGHLPEGVKKTLLSINMGMQVMGSPKCPFNDLGICIHQLARIPDDQFPEEIKKDLAAREGSIVQRRVAGLMTFAHNNSVSRIFDNTVEFNEGDGNKAQQRKRSPHTATVERRDMVLAESMETPLSFNRVVIRMVNGDRDYALEDLEDADALRTILDQLIEEKPVKKYMETYRDGKLNDVFDAAFHSIMTLPYYRGTNKMISQWLDRKQKPYPNKEGGQETYRRYSAGKAAGVSGGPVGRRTRILFSEGIKDGTRYVTIHKVAYRDERTYD